MKKMKSSVWNRRKAVKCIRYLVLSMAGCILFGNIFGCGAAGGRGGNPVETDRSEEEIADELIQSVIDALEAEDSEALKGLFSEYALKNAHDLDEKIKELISFYPGSNGGYTGNVPSHRTSDYGEITYVITPAYKVINDEEMYEICITAYVENDTEPERVGVHIIQVMMQEAEPDGFKWKDEEDDPGIYVLE